MSTSNDQLSIAAKDVRYLCFEGGGGKGAVYLGALDALELKKILPIVPGGQIIGISGASAGAITALLVACGFKASDTAGIRKRFLDNPATDFFDRFTPGEFRRLSSYSVKLDNTAQKGRGDFLSFLNPWWLPSSRLLNIPIIKRNLESFINSQSEDTQNAIVKLLNSPPQGGGVIDSIEAMITSLLFDGGLFIGNSVQSFLTSVVRDALTIKRNEKNKGKAKKDQVAVDVSDTEAATLTFDEFQAEFGVRLAIPVTDTGYGIPRIYTTSDLMDKGSLRAAPLSVVDAVGISMSIPFVFKPVPVPYLGGSPSGYCDGGAVNNFPLHAFDALDSNGKLLRANARGALNPCMLGFNLSSADPIIVKDWFPQTEDMFLFKMLSNFLGAVLYSGDRGQIQSPNQTKQVITVNCGSISTFDLGAATKLAKTQPYNVNDPNDPEGLVYGACLNVYKMLR